MKKVSLPLAKISVLLFAVNLAGCAHGGRDFNYAATSSLEPGNLKSSEYKKVIGAEPLQQRTITNVDGRFDLVRYLHVSAILGTAKVHTVILEFKNDILNAYIRTSNFDDEVLGFHRDKVKQLIKGISTKKDVRRVMGKAHGIGLCPTFMEDYTPDCTRGTEVWSWMAISQLSSFTAAANGLLVDIRAIFVIFDANGVVSDVRLSKGL
jgi:hypothetical protein